VKVTLEIYNIQGQVVKTLINENQTAGIKSVMWDGTNNNNKSVSSGIYIYSLQIGDYYSTKQSKKMLLIK
jgi:flagellar hook assembly protein FlgD